jgi:hypothetical protein
LVQWCWLKKKKDKTSIKKQWKTLYKLFRKTGIFCLAPFYFALA